MKRLLDFSKFVNEGVVNETEMPAEGGIMIMTEGGAIKQGVPYIIVDPSSLRFSVNTRTERSYVTFDDDTTENGDVSIGGQNLSNRAAPAKEEAIAKTPSDCQSKAYEILLTIYSTFKPSQGQGIDLKFMESLVKSILMVAKNNTTKTLIVKNSRFKSFVSGIVNTPTEAAAKASMGRLANMDGIEVDQIFKAVRAGIA
jgi:hypothetical protein